MPTKSKAAGQKSGQISEGGPSNPPIWLLGSGASKAAGIPLVGDVDRFVFEKPVWRHTGGSYVMGENPSSALGDMDTYVPRVRALLRWARAMVERAQPSGPGNYEEVFYFLQQIRDDEFGEYENPAVSPMAEKAQDFQLILDSVLETPRWEDLSLGLFIDEGCRLISDAASSALSPGNLDLDVLNPLVACVREFRKTKKQVVVGTLNHDVLIESVFQKKRVSCCDGFSRKRGFQRVFDRSLFNSAKSAAVLLKLHGSARWVVVQGDNGRQTYSEIVDWNEFDKQRVEHAGLDIVDEQPRILIGTHNKILGYSRPLFWHLFAKFRTSLEENTRLIVVGYGFQDKGINEILIDWLTESKKRRMVVVNPSVAQTKENSRPAISRVWDRWVDEGQVVEVPKGFEAVKWPYLKSLL